jgi:hypothetical protein
MSPRPWKSSALRIGAALAASTMAVGLLAPAVSASTAGGQAAGEASHEAPPLPPCNLTAAGAACQLDDLAGVVTAAVEPTLSLTCGSSVNDAPFCQASTDNTPFSG